MRLGHAERGLRGRYEADFAANSESCKLNEQCPRMCAGIDGSAWLADLAHLADGTRQMTKQTSQNTPQKSSARQRIRGTIYLCGLDRRLTENGEELCRPVALTRCLLLARVLMLGAAEAGKDVCIWTIPPNEGAPLRRYMEGGDAPKGFETVQVFQTTNYAREVANLANVSLRFARMKIHEVLADGQKVQNDTLNEDQKNQAGSLQGVAA